MFSCGVVRTRGIYPGICTNLWANRAYYIPKRVQREVAIAGGHTYHRCGCPPTIFATTGKGTPASIMRDMAVSLRSWKRHSTLASRFAFSQEALNRAMGFSRVHANSHYVSTAWPSTLLRYEPYRFRSNRKDTGLCQGITMHLVSSCMNVLTIQAPMKCQ